LLEKSSALIKAKAKAKTLKIHTQEKKVLFESIFLMSFQFAIQIRDPVSPPVFFLTENEIKKKICIA
jgi:hypothetical protein